MSSTMKVVSGILLRAPRGSLGWMDERRGRRHEVDVVCRFDFPRLAVVSSLTETVGNAGSLFRIRR